MSGRKNFEFLSLLALEQALGGQILDAILLFITTPEGSRSFHPGATQALLASRSSCAPGASALIACLESAGPQSDRKETAEEFGILRH